MFAVIMLLALIGAVAHAVAQAVPPEAAQFLDLLDTLLRLTTLAFAVLPITEVRKLFGGLPAIPLPGGHEIKAGRWFSWVVGAAVFTFGLFAHWIKLSSDPATYQAQLVLAYTIMVVLANIIYEKFWRGQLGFDAVVGETTITK